ncbi:hypothetical protein ASPACDRAFT_64869 [Aspergillus aculeatus ATCC 16872]|uniref:SUR7 protein n=1 Tax=Aspergillus aculeatus (strain ATCC 16872 / CBS 172.66 / WB 5094) TaxID=690307 RepID=A0A1L9WFK6_ASPA1|nr:uncharacterized protein ASPACDRAFT_64869 [Aspergillus aculeatus ATCC 16872]OJJ94949.1 hypothetical protein ASPACDRAFT_64869 [Aspergillus aculeatus ATCC 16872]
MGQLGRFVCVLGSSLLSVGSLICLMIVTIGCINPKQATDFYMFRIELKNLTTSPSSILDTTLQDLTGGHVKQFVQALQEANKSETLQDFYSIALWNYCAGNNPHIAVYNSTYCSKPRGGFWFDPIEIWGLNQTHIGKHIPNRLQQTLDIYHRASLWMQILYLLAICTSILQLLVGLLVCCSRLGSCVAWLLAGASLLFTLAASVTSTMLFATLAGTFKVTFKAYGIYGHMGRHIYAATWLAVALSLLAAVSWLLNCCCFRGDKARRDPARTICPVAAADTAYSHRPFTVGKSSDVSDHAPLFICPSPPQVHGGQDYRPYQQQRHQYHNPYENIYLETHEMR